jgi:hypothetical protein
MNAIKVLERYRLDKMRSPSAVIHAIGLIIDEDDDQMFVSNRIISEFGGQPSDKPVEAGLIARCLIEQAHIKRDDFDLAEAYKYAEAKVEKLRVTMPYLWCTNLAASNDGKAEQVADKRIQAQRIFLSNQHLKNSEIVRLMVAEMGITETNAAYYASNFRKKQKA